ncbi:cupredoxin domain-containing protein [Sphingobium mellinum]|uniref:cupredoxin domain-containing protein n=1 Tax=Sphingobium mellinum TaxID=1387166 RepID=UPI0030EDDF0F
MPRLRTLIPLCAACALASAGAAQPVADNWANARPLTVTLSSFRFEPSDIRLDHGVAYDLRLANRSTGGHDFASPAFFAQAQLRSDDMAKVRNGRIEVDGGDSVEIHLIAPAPGTYKVHCTHFMHSAFGMTGHIIVR